MPDVRNSVRSCQHAFNCTFKAISGLPLYAHGIAYLITSSAHVENDVRNVLRTSKKWLLQSECSLCQCTWTNEVAKIRLPCLQIQPTPLNAPETHDRSSPAPAPGTIVVAGAASSTDRARWDGRRSSC